MIASLFRCGGGGSYCAPRTALSLVRGYQNCTPYGVVGFRNFGAVAISAKLFIIRGGLGKNQKYLVD